MQERRPLESYNEALPLELHMHVLSHAICACPSAAVALASTSRAQLNALALMRPHLERSLWFVAAPAEGGLAGGLESMRVVRTAADAVARLTSASTEDEHVFRKQRRVGAVLCGAGERVMGAVVDARLASAYMILEALSLLLIDDPDSALYSRSLPGTSYTARIARTGVVDLTWRSEWWLEHALVKRVAAFYRVLRSLFIIDPPVREPVTKQDGLNRVTVMCHEYRGLLMKRTGRALTLDGATAMATRMMFAQTMLPIGVASDETLRESRPHLFQKHRNTMETNNLRPLLFMSARRLEQMSGGLLNAQDHDAIMKWPYQQPDMDPGLRARIASLDVLSNVRRALDDAVASHVTGASFGQGSGARTPRAVPVPFSALFDGPLFLSHDFRGMLLWIDMTSPLVEQLIGDAVDP